MSELIEVTGSKNKQIVEIAEGLIAEKDQISDLIVLKVIHDRDTREYALVYESTYIDTYRFRGILATLLSRDDGGSLDGM